MKLFEPQFPKVEPAPGERIPGELKDEIRKSGKVSVGETFIKPRIIGGVFEGATFRTAASGARVTILPVDDTTLGIACYDDTGAPVFTTKILGDDIGDIILGNLDEGKYVKWDAGDAMLYINGITLSDFVAVGVATGSDLALQKWTSSLIFTASDYNTVAWTGGEIRMTGGAVYTITGGNTGNMAQLTYIYFDSDISSTALQLSTDPTDTVGANKIQIGVATPNPGAGMNRRAKFQIYSGSGGMIVSVDDLAANDDSTNEFVTATAELADDVVTYAKIQNMNTARVLGRTSASAGIIEELQAGAGIAISGGSISCSIGQYTDEMAQDAVGDNVGAGLDYNDTDGEVYCTITQYTDELAEDAIGGILTDTDTIDLTYNDGANTISADVKLTAMVTKLSTTGSINAKTVATTNLYTVPAGKTAVITMAIVRVTAADTVTVVPTAGIGVAAGEADIFAPTALTDLDDTTKVYAYSASGTYVNVAAAGIIKLGIDVGATATTMTIAVDLFGYLI